MEQIQVMQARLADELHLGNVKDAYCTHMEIISAAAIELRNVKFINNVPVPIAPETTANLIVITRNSVSQAQDILFKNNPNVAAILEPPTTHRKTSLSRHSPGQAKAGAMRTEQPASSQLHSTNNSTEPQQSSSPSSPRVSATVTAATVPSSPISSHPPAPSLPLPPPPPLQVPSSPQPTGSAEASSPTSSPLLSRALSLPIVPPKPTRKPPQQPVVSPTPTNRSPALELSEQDTMPSIGASTGVRSLLPSDIIISSPTKPSDHHFRPISMPIDTLPQSKPRVPPKPARLHRQLSEIKAPDTDDSDDDDDEDGDDDLEDHVYPPTLHRRASSPSIAIPGRRPPSSVPTSPTISPSSISSSISLERPRSYTLPHPQYPSLGQGASFITVIPEGCVDPTNLTEAERIKVENEDQLDQKTYGPGDHVPHIPVAPLITTHRSLADKEKTYSDKVEEIKRKLQEKATQPQNGLKQQGNEVDTIHSLQESLASYRSMQSGVKATISKVRELTFRSASVGSVLEFPPYLVAYQLTLIESAIFLMIPPAALLTHSPKSPHRTITASTDFFNYLTRLIEYSILLPQEASGRAQCLHYWVKVAVKLHELENFQTLKAVLSAFGTPPIKRLKRTWSFVPRRSMHKLETLSELMSETRNYGKYREMMASLNTGSGSPSSGATLSGQSTSAPGGKLDMLSLNGVTQGLSSLGFKAKPVRKPMVPFLGTFIMDSTYLLAAVKKCANAVPPISVPATSSLREKPASIASYSSSTTDVASIISSNGTLVGSEEDARIQETLIQDARIQELLQTLSAYQAGPKYSSQPPRSYIKSATKSHHHFRAPSLSNPLHRTSKYRASSMDRQIGANINHQSSYEEEEDDVSGNGLRPTQQLILHYLLTRPWIPEKMVDEMSVALEPSKNKAASSGNGTVSSMGSSRTSAGASSSSTTLTAPTTHSWPGAGGSSHVSLASTLQRGSTGSNNSGDGFQNGSGGSSRPTSVED